MATSKKKYLTCTFSPRDLPMALIFHNGEILGPFCRHCGWRRGDHDTKGHCLAVANAFFLPNCGCHAVDLGPTSNGARLVQNHNGSHVKEPAL